jgi:hypothetical protein
MFFAAVFCTYTCALLLSLAMEVPVAHIDKLIFGSGGGGSQRLQSTARSNTGTSGEQEKNFEEKIEFIGEENMEDLELNELKNIEE